MILVRRHTFVRCNGELGTPPRFSYRAANRSTQEVYLLQEGDYRLAQDTHNTSGSVFLVSIVVMALAFSTVYEEKVAFSLSISKHPPFVTTKLTQ